MAFALQEDGWILRQDIIWSKPNAMPESVTDRPTKSHEYIFLFTKKERYYYDAQAIAEPAGSWHGGKFITDRKREVYNELGMGQRNGYEKLATELICRRSSRCYLQNSYWERGPHTFERPSFCSGPGSDSVDSEFAGHLPRQICTVHCRHQLRSR